MSSRATQLFWYVVPLSENQTSPAHVKLNIQNNAQMHHIYFQILQLQSLPGYMLQSVNITHIVDSV